MTPWVTCNMSATDAFGLLPNKTAARKLCHNLAQVAEVGDLQTLCALLKEYQNNPKLYSKDTFCSLVVNAYWRSCEKGHLDCLKALQPFVKPDDQRYSLIVACEYGNDKLVKYLASHFPWKETQPVRYAVLAAVRGGSLKILNTVLPHVKNKQHRTEALRQACTSNNQAAFDVLYPVSNPQSALKYMENGKTISEGEKQILKDAIDAEKQHKVLSEAVGNVGGTKRKKM